MVAAANRRAGVGDEARPTPRSHRENLMSWDLLALYLRDHQLVERLAVVAAAMIRE